MFDTIGLKYYTNEIVKWHNLDFANEVNNINTGLTKMRGKLSNLQVYEIPEGINIFGSLSKYYLSNNLESLTRKTTKQAIEKLSDELSLKIENSKMYRIDVSQNFIMQSKVKNYLNCLDELKGFKKVIYDKSIYFKKYLIELIIYDKIAEMRKNRAFIPEDFKQLAGKILRYEMRYMRNIKKTFNKDIQLKDLTDEQFYNLLIEKWKSLYFEITKKNKLKFNDMALKDVKQFQNQLMLIGLNSLGLDEVNNMIELSRDELERYQISRIKAKIKKIKKTKELTEVNPLIKELDSKIDKKNVYC
jgi:hypothetical protein